jgi:hypothetical protein
MARSIPSPGAGLAEFYFRLDLRSLGFYRILLGLLLFVDTWSRLPDLQAFYTDAGILPAARSGLISGGRYHFSLLDSFHSLTWVRCYFAASLVCFGLFLAGYRTRLFHALSLIAFVSIVTRNTLVREGNDRVLISMLLWTLFLPMGRRFSLDAFRASRERPGDPLGPFSLVAFFAVTHLGLIYLGSAAAKSGALWADGTALYYAFRLDQFALGIAPLFRDAPLAFIKFLTWSTLAIELLALPAFLCPFGRPHVRRVTILALVALHAGIALTMDVGFFSAVMIASYAILLRPEDWDWLERRMKSIPFARRFARPAPDAIGRVPPADPPPARAPGQRWSERWRPGFWLAQGIATAIFLTFLVNGYNSTLRNRLRLPAIPEAPGMRAFISTTQLVYSWGFFAPDPPKVNSWLVVDALNEDGSHVDPLTGDPPTFAPQIDFPSNHRRRWGKCFELLRKERYAPYRRDLAIYLTRMNRREFPPGQRMVSFRIYRVAQRIAPPGTVGPTNISKTVLLSWNCTPSKNAQVSQL